MLSGKRLWQAKRNKYIYSMLGHAKKGEMVKAQDVFKRMTERGIYPDVVAYNTLIKGYVVNNDAKNAFKAFNNLKKRRLLPCDRTYSSMFAVCGRSQSNDILLKVMAEIERRGVRLNSVAFNSMLAAMAQCGMVEEAFEEAEKVTEPTIETFGALLLVCAKNSIEKLESVWKDMINKGLTPELHCYNTLLFALKNSHIPHHMTSPSSHVTSVPNSSRTLKAEKELRLDLHDFMPLTLYIEGQLRWLETTDIDQFLSRMKKLKICADVRMHSLLVALSPDIFSILEKCKIPLDSIFFKTVIRRLKILGDVEGLEVLMDLAGDHGLYSDLDRAKLCDTKEETEKLLESLTEEPTDGKTRRTIDPERYEQVYEVLISKAIKRRDYDSLILLIKKLKHAEILPPNDLLKQLDTLIADPPKKWWLKRKSEGFEGYYKIWKKAMGLTEQ